MLAELKRSTSIEIGDNLPGLEDSDKRQQLKLSDAFSHLVVGEHEIVAVTTRIADKVWNVLITKNYSRDDNDTFPTTPYLEIMSPSKPDDLKGQSAFEYMRSYTSNPDKKPPSLSTHLWIMSNVLSRGGQSNQNCPSLPELTTHLSRYITARSYKKMERRFNNKILSAPYFKSLAEVVMHQSTFHSERNIGGNRDQMELENDKLFLEDFIVTLAKEHNNFIDLDIPNILKLATNLSPENKTPELYTKETSEEFHRLLLYLLQNFQAALDHRRHKRMATTEGTSAKDRDLTTIFSENIRKVHMYGYGLLRLSRGRAFQLHL
ncbi:hypothetical protein K443DRAFT_116785, partial [Laccaria amethystina LaAM-08-1]